MELSVYLCVCVCMYYVILSQQRTSTRRKKPPARDASRQTTGSQNILATRTQSAVLCCCVHCVLASGWLVGWLVARLGVSFARTPQLASPSLALFMICCENVCRGNRKEKQNEAQDKTGDAKKLHRTATKGWNPHRC